MKAIKKITSVGLVLVMFLMLTGCASQEAYKGYLDNHSASATGYYKAAEKPLVDITLPSPIADQPYHIVLNREVKPMAPEQIKDSEWVKPVNGLISAAGMVGGIWAAGDAIGKITENSGHNTTTSIGGDDNSIGRDNNKLTNAEGGSMNLTGDTTTTTDTTTTSTSTTSTQNSGNM